ncbi:MAG: hypothetical protein U9P49_03680, partial [Thermodesulfobacteriota bacterium]|nr:hypothetical protein [Thermodesulfobacteriota bacterium]
ICQHTDDLHCFCMCQYHRQTYGFFRTLSTYPITQINVEHIAIDVGMGSDQDMVGMGGRYGVGPR